MGNSCNGTKVIKDQGEMEFASAIPVHLTQKLQNESSRLYQIMLSKSEQENPSYLTQDKIEEFILTLKPYSPLESPDSITIAMKIKSHDFSYKSDNDYKIDEDVIIDPNRFEDSILKVVDRKSGQKFSMKVTNFDDHDDYQFKAALYEIYILQLIKAQASNTDFLVQIKDAYILESEDKQVHHPSLIITKHHKGSIIMFTEYCDSTLHEVIAFRRFHDWKWTDDQVSSIFADLTVGLSQLQALNIAHRDLRPHNIWYSVQDQRYKISGFQDAKLIKKSALQRLPAQLGLQAIGIKDSELDGEDMLNTIRGVPDFLPPEVSVYVDSQQQVGKYNPFLQDVFALGLCVTMCQFLANHFESPDIRGYITRCKAYRHSGSKSNLAHKNYHDVLTLMLIGDERQRLSTVELALIVSSNTLNPKNISVNEENIIKSMKFKKKLHGVDTVRVYQLIAVAYFDLFQWDKWSEKMEEIYESFENVKDERNQAQVLLDIAEGYLEINNPHSGQDYFIRASILFNEVGHQDRKSGSVDEAIKNYSTALDCVRKAHNGEDSYEGALMLENLGNVFRIQGDTKKARSYLEEASRIVSQEKGQDSLEAAKMFISLGKIYTMLADYKQALKRIKKAIKIIDNYQAANQNSNSMASSFLTTAGSTNQSQILRASALSAMGELQRLKGRLDKARSTLEEALQLRQSLQGTGHVDVASTLENLGNVFFEMEDFHSAKTYYEQALVIKKSKLGEINSEIALTLNNIGNACKHLGEQDKAQKFFTDALQILQQVHGNENHQLMGTTYGNLGILLKEQGNKQGAQHCLIKCTNILQNTLDPDHPDQQFYLEHLSQAQH